MRFWEGACTTVTVTAFSIGPSLVHGKGSTAVGKTPKGKRRDEVLILNLFLAVDIQPSVL